MAEPTEFEVIETPEPAPEPSSYYLEELATLVPDLLAERETTIVRQRDDVEALLDRLREAYLAAEPALDAGLLTGDTLLELEASHRAAVALIERVRARVEATSQPSIPAGAPGRLVQLPDSPIEKIRAGLARLSR